MEMDLKTKFLVALFSLTLLIGCGRSSHKPPNERIAWAVGYRNTAGLATLLRSEDGGGTWYAPDPNATQLQGFDAINLMVPSENEVWIVGSNQTLLHTLDGGKSWEKITTFPEKDSAVIFHDISAYSASDFWISGEHGTVYHTRDGGVHWEKMDPDLFDDGLVQGIRVIDKTTVYAVGQNADFSRGFVRRTADGGKTWEAVILPDDYNANFWIGVTSSDSDHIVVYGRKGHYSASEDGGKHWINGHIDIPGGVNGADINDLIMLDATHWWSAMDLDNIYMTEDGGKHWSKQQSAGASDMFLVGIDAVDEKHALIVGHSNYYPPTGKIILTLDGGKHWAQKYLTDTYMSKVSFVHRLHRSKKEESTLSETSNQNP